MHLKTHSSFCCVCMQPSPWCQGPVHDPIAQQSMLSAFLTLTEIHDTLVTLVEDEMSWVLNSWWNSQITAACHTNSCCTHLESNEIGVHAPRLLRARSGASSRIRYVSVRNSITSVPAKARSLECKRQSEYLSHKYDDIFNKQSCWCPIINNIRIALNFLGRWTTREVLIMLCCCVWGVS